MTDMALPIDRDNCRLQQHQAQGCHVIGYHCLIVDDAGSLGKDKRVAIVLEHKVKHGDADAVGYVGDLAGVDFYNLRGINTFRVHHQPFLDDLIDEVYSLPFIIPPLSHYVPE